MRKCFHSSSYVVEDQRLKKPPTSSPFGYLVYRVCAQLGAVKNLCFLLLADSLAIIAGSDGRSKSESLKIEWNALRKILPVHLKSSSKPLLYCARHTYHKSHLRYIGVAIRGRGK